MATLYHASGTVEDVTPANGKTFTLAELQGVVGGYIEIARAPAGAWLVMNENGKRETPALNVAATELMRGRLQPGDYIAGNALLTSWTEIEGDEPDGDE